MINRGFALDKDPAAPIIEPPKSVRLYPIQVDALGNYYDLPLVPLVGPSWLNEVSYYEVLD